MDFRKIIFIIFSFTMFYIQTQEVFPKQDKESG